MQNKHQQWMVLKRLIRYLKPYTWLTICALAFLLFTTIIKSVIPLVASQFIDHYLHDLNHVAILMLLGYYCLYILQMLVQYVGNSSLRACPIVSSEIFDEMPLLIWKNWGCPSLIRHLQVPSCLV